MPPAITQLSWGIELGMELTCVDICETTHTSINAEPMAKSSEISTELRNRPGIDLDETWNRPGIDLAASAKLKSTQLNVSLHNGLTECEQHNKTLPAQLRHDEKLLNKKQ